MGLNINGIRNMQTISRDSAERKRLCWKSISTKECALEEEKELHKKEKKPSECSLMFS